MPSTAGITSDAPLARSDALDALMVLSTGHVGHYSVCAEKQRCLVYIKKSMCTPYVPLLPPTVIEDPRSQRGPQTASDRRPVA